MPEAGLLVIWFCGLLGGFLFFFHLVSIGFFFFHKGQYIVVEEESVIYINTYISLNNKVVISGVVYLALVQEHYF